MSEIKCERCGASEPWPGASGYSLFHYCVHCSRNLCDACTAKGCCGHVPAETDDHSELE